jgi:HPt (histidine-containing phosphotransfer) domain-containing protein
MDGFDDEEWAEMQEMYIKFTSKELEKIQENMDTATMESLRTFGHNIKGSGGMYGFDSVTELGAKIEAAAKEDKLEEIRSFFKDLSDFLEQEMKK